ncbi:MULTISPECIES: winged helix-turn-helix transcriptional regulator [unclassified Agarivorans]|uniref:winged helix-turn-helix transcriptional regulator n=1 Tax=unclassified Agarivorans TaxID=2636026 RepID=UPI0026E13A80|nr:MULTISPECIES: helix-turn-helix domain-containing protein [unclassified Agarivorans]MDO6684480.1 helix-turn-helix domain-containing protein [Agarivorans sp. 3_MG-2023]MDO6714645.1 helix-turn-helix domain-containing protein [Agarivorans sp. 2_MG-2023]
MKTTSYNPCPLQKMLDSIGGKWKILIIYNLKNTKAIRFGALNQLLAGVSQKVLTSQLKELEADGFVHRKAYPEVPPRVEYRLTKKGHSLYPVLDSMALWASENAE